MERMDEIKAKPVIDNEYWILRENDRKIGEVIKIQSGDYEVRIKGMVPKTFSNLDLLKKSPMFTFEDIIETNTEVNKEVEGYPTVELAYNAVWNVKYGLPLYTQTNASKSWLAAGYYKINIHGTWISQYCPKLITLQRNEYTGPYKSDPSMANFNRIFE